MNTTRKAGLALASLAALGLAAALPQAAHAQTTIFTDNYDVPGSSQDINANLGPGQTRQTGTALPGDGSGIGYNELLDTTGGGNNRNYRTQVGNGPQAGPGPGGPLLFASGYNNYYDNITYVYASPNYNFVPSGNNLIVSFDVDTNNNGSDFNSFVFGASTQGAFVNASDGIGFLLRTTPFSGDGDSFQAFDGSTLIADTTYTSNGPTSYQHVVLTLTNAFNSTGPSSVGISVNGSPIVFEATPGAGGSSTYTGHQQFTSNYLTLGGYSGGFDVSFFDNLAVTTPAAAPEPSQTAALGLGVLGLAGLALSARRRQARNA